MAYNGWSNWETWNAYSGPLVLRPEHWSCNSAKGIRPDWENSKFCH
jgi:hypothetical protein